MPSSDDLPGSATPDLILAEGRGEPVPGPDEQLFAPDVLAQAWAQVLGPEAARAAAAAAYEPGVDPRDVAWDEGTIIMVALLSDEYRARVRAAFRWSEAELARRIDAARPLLERWRRDAAAEAKDP